MFSMRRRFLQRESGEREERAFGPVAFCCESFFGYAEPLEYSED
ncbi:MAG: hypothetical protein PHT34_02910 [Oscillospiraceae bacterium]|nr:hypothetical protein [Oscillospiraceae bacterium]